MTDVVLVREPAPPPSVILVHTSVGTEVVLPPDVPPSVVIVEAVRGPQGMQGTQGGEGVQGGLGLQGPQGVQGQRGTQGPQGVQGVGMQGVQGEFVTGPQGPQGDQGIPGIGLDGAQGPQGVSGAQGLQGAGGTQGPQGRQGVAGSSGTSGGVGPQGPAGSVGPPGAAGGAGPQGPQGSSGFAPGGDLTVNNVTATGTVLSTNLPASAIKDISGGNYSFTARNDVGGPAVMTFHRSGAYAAYLGIDNDNVWKVGGWSMNANSYALLHEGNSFSFYTGGLNAGSKSIYTVAAVYANRFQVNVIPSGGSGALFPDWNTGSVQKIELTGASSISPLGVPAWNTMMLIIHANDQTITWGGTIYWVGGAPPNLNAGATRWANVYLTNIGGNNFFGKADIF